MSRLHKAEPSDNSSKARITLICSVEQRKKIRMLAAQEDMSMNEFLLSLVKEKEKRCPLCEKYGPNELTIKTLKEADMGENVEDYDNVEDFWKSIGRDIDAETKK